MTTKLVRLSLLIFCLSFFTASAGGQMDSLNANIRLDTFKRKIRFDEVLSRESIELLILRTNVGPEKYSVLQGWRFENGDNSVLGDEEFQQWIFKKNKESLLIELYLSTKGVAETRKRFLNTVDLTSTIAIPFGISPEQIGTLTIVSEQRPSNYLIFIYKNVYVHVRSFDSDIDILAVAKGIYLQIDKK